MPFLPVKKSIDYTFIFGKKATADLRTGSKILAASFVFFTIFSLIPNDLFVAHAINVGGASGRAIGAGGVFRVLPGATFGGSKTGEGGGMTLEEAIAALKAIMKGQFNDPAFIQALIAYMADTGADIKTLDTNPQQFVDNMTKYIISTNPDAQGKALDEIAKESPAGSFPISTGTLTDAQKATLKNSATTLTTTTVTTKDSSTGKTTKVTVTSSTAAALAIRQWTNLKMPLNADNLQEYAAAHGERVNPNTGKVEYYSSSLKTWVVDASVENTLSGHVVQLDDTDACVDAFGQGWLGSGGGSGGSSKGGSSSGGSSGGGTTEPVKPTITNTTNAVQSCANPILSVSTNRAAACQYNESGGFNYGNGTSFSTSGNYNHNTGLSNLANGDHTYYIICKDNSTGGVSDALKVEFKVDLSLDPENAPKVTSATSDKQTNSTPELAVITDRKATCQYKNSSFTFGAGTALATSNNYSHSVSIASLADGSHTFYVICRDNTTNAVSAAKQVTTLLDRTTGNEPVITNTTNSYQTVSNPLMSITTTRNSTCQYKDSSFAYGSGTQFTTDGATSHSVQLNNVSDGQHTYYVVCKDAASGAINTSAAQIIFTVAATAPTVNNITPASQTGSDPVLAVTTDRPASCQYKDSSFTFGAGTALATSNNYSHSVSIASLADGSHTFYVICRDNATGALSGAKQIVTALDRSTVAGAPVLTNATLDYQTTSSPILLINTNIAATCQYKDSSFAYGSGTQFTTDGATSHSVQLNNVSDGQHAYYVICKGVASNVSSGAGYQVIFTVSAGGNVNNCASLSSNDRKNDNNRSNAGNTDANSVYPWQAAETGTRERFAKVDWHAGYQFTPNKNGRVTQLCGYFDSGATNKVTLFNGTYEELASAQVAGSGSWRCVDISPVSIEVDKRYYVIARVENNPIYFEYKSGLLPKNSGNVVIEAGIRQTIINSNFKTDIVKYDYMIFGLVDVKITYSQSGTAGPSISSIGPVGTVNSSSAKISAQTNQSSTCRFDRDDIGYGQMSYALPNEINNTFSQKVCNLENGSYTFYVRCKNSAGAENNASTPIQFNVAQ